MPKIVVRAYATFRDTLPSGVLELSTRAETVGELVDTIGKEYGPKFKAILYDSAGNVRPHNKVLLNGRNIIFLRGLETSLKDGDIIAFFPSVGGG